jgi:negative regulator of replication initiation
MMPTIRIDNDVWNHLKRKAEPFEDTPNSVLRRLLRLEKKSRKARRIPTGTRTAQSAYRMPILRTLVELGGKGKVDRVLGRVEKRMATTLKSIDRQKISTGMVRWRNSAMWERKTMVDEGLLSKASARGVWEITTRGREFVEGSGA